MKTIIVIVMCLITQTIFSQTKTQPKTPKTPALPKVNKTERIDKQGEMKTYFMVFLMKGDKRDQDSLTVAEIQKAHLEHLTNMANQGKMDIAGPFLDDNEMRGICIYNVPTIEEAKFFAESDPAVKSGRLKVIVRPWYSMKGASLK